MEGTDFLGYNIKMVKDLKRLTKTFLLVKPSRKSIQKVKDNIKMIVKKYRYAPADVLIMKLNPVLRG